METIRLTLKKIFNFVGLLFKIAVFSIDFGGVVGAVLFSWIYEDEKDADGAMFAGWVIGSSVWLILCVLVYNWGVGK